MMWGNSVDYGWGMWLMMGLGVAGFWVLVAAVVRSLLADRRTLTAPAVQGPTTIDPLRELDGRLARGEISAEEYSATRRLITDGH